MTTMYQCDLSIGNRKTRAYIEAKGAKVGVQVRLKDTDDDQEFWTVDSVADTGIDEQYLKYINGANRKTRIASDI
jgi:hypothetical protein